MPRIGGITTAPGLAHLTRDWKYLGLCSGCFWVKGKAIDTMCEEESKIVNFFRDRSVFVTGASGFMGKVLVEKLLYSCPDVHAIYILMRSKRSKSAEQRTEEMFRIPLFDRVRKERPDAFKKVLPLPGDITLEDLGLSPESKREIQEEVSVVFHFAATLRLEAKLKDAVEMNTKGTWRILQLAKTMKNLKSFVHLSTAFCHCDYDELKETIYPAPVDPEEIMRCVQWMDEKTLNILTPSLLAPHPNTYTYTKRLAEKLVADQFPTLPVAIARPAIVTPSWKDPVPGWVDSLNGPIGLVVGGGKGVIRSMHCKGEYHSEVIAVDFAINGLIQIAWKTAECRENLKEIPVYNMTASAVKQVSWQEVLDKGRNIVYENPFEMTIWYPDGNLRSTKFMHNVCVIFLHWLPAYFIDLLLFIFRQKRFMVRLQHKIHDGLEVLQYFTTREWNFDSTKFSALKTELPPKDQEIFFTDFEQVDEDEYLLNCILGARQYCLKEPLSSLPRCRRNLKILYVIDRLWSLIFYMFLLWMVVSYSETARYVLDTSTDCIKSLPVVRNFVALTEK